jgi:sRNA-binding regulator protein Hfq
MSLFNKFTIYTTDVDKFFFCIFLKNTETQSLLFDTVISAFLIFNPIAFHFFSYLV